MICSFVISFIIQGNNINAFISGFLGIGLLWMVMAWKLNVETNSIMSSKVVQLIEVVDDPNTLIIVTGIIGGMVGGFSAFSGNSFRQIFIKKKKPSLYS